MKPRRSIYEVVWEILTYCREPRRLTHIMTACNLNTESAKRYLNLLIEKRLLKKQGSEYVATEKGMRYVRLFRELYLELFSE